MEYRAGSRSHAVPLGRQEARDTLNTVLVCLSLLLFTLLLSCRAARLQRESLSARSGDGALLEIGGLRRAAGALVPAAAGLLQAGAGDLEKRAGSRRSAGCSARINVWASLLVLAAALLRYWDLTVIQPPGSGFRRGAGAGGIVENRESGALPVFMCFQGTSGTGSVPPRPSSLEGAVRSAATSVSGAPFAMATPDPGLSQKAQVVGPAAEGRGLPGIDPQTAAQGAQSFSLLVASGALNSRLAGMEMAWTRFGNASLHCSITWAAGPDRGNRPELWTEPPPASTASFRSSTASRVRLTRAKEGGWVTYCPKWS